MTDEKPPSPPEADPVNSPDSAHLIPDMEDEPESTFLDKTAAFAVLIFPSCYLISKIQGLLLDFFPNTRTISNMWVLFSLLGFVVGVGALAKVIFRLRLKHSSRSAPPEDRPPE
jgi:hypothetical protein